MRYRHYLQVFAGLALRLVVSGGALFGPLSVHAQEATGRPLVVLAPKAHSAATQTDRSFTASVKRDGRRDSQSESKLWTGFQGEDLVGRTSFGLLVFDRFQPGSGPISVGTMELPGSWYGPQIQSGQDSVGAHSVIFGASYDPFKTFDQPNGSAAARFGLAPQLDDLLRGGPAVYPDAVWVGAIDDGEGTKHGSHFEAAMTARFVFGKNTRYPVIVTFPAYLAMGDEEYYFGPHFGYITAGINVRVPLSFISNRYRRWSVGTSADLCYYGTTATELVKSIGFQVPRVAAALSVDL